MKITWLGVVVFAVLLLFMSTGYRRGFIKEIVSFFFVFLSLSLAWAINPYINNFLVQKTPIYSTIRENCNNFVNAEDAEPEYETEAPGNFIDRLDLPDILRENLQKNNNAETYTELSVNTLTEYVSGYLAETIINGLSYVLAYVISAVMIRLIVCVLNLIAGLPVLKTANKLTGGAVGFFKGLVIVWIAFLILTVLCSTQIGKNALELIEKDTLLSTLYQYDPLVRIFAKIF